MKINTANFICSNTDWRKCPKENMPEYAFIGRSNVGKSSLINALTNSKKLAKISGKPGKTQLINHFLINEKFYFADLPGYGYAKISKKTREEFQSFTLKYLKNRENLVCLFLLIDLRVSPQKIDLEFMEFCALKKIPFVICFTKSDKLKKTEIVENTKQYKDYLLKQWESFPINFTTSSAKKTGLQEIMSFIDENNIQFKY
ncbi:MAG: YihA family ribosome biogenesis GTP-binding protein [Flavobacteriales bacterium]|nr:YihA family ribosome biogenesis GTP-binding protein [Flavobacteriales bacterium]